LGITSLILKEGDVLDRKLVVFIVGLSLWFLLAINFGLTNVPLEIGLLRDNSIISAADKPLLAFWLTVAERAWLYDFYSDADNFFYHFRRLADLTTNGSFSIYTIFGYPVGSELENPKFLGYLFSNALVNTFGYDSLTSAMLASNFVTYIVSVASLITNYVFLKSRVSNSWLALLASASCIPSIFAYQAEATQLSILGFNLIFLAVLSFSNVKKFTYFYFSGVLLTCISSDFHAILYLIVANILLLISISVNHKELQWTKLLASYCIVNLGVILLLFEQFTLVYILLQESLQNLNAFASFESRSYHPLLISTFLDVHSMRKVLSVIGLPEYLFPNSPVKLNPFFVLIFLSGLVFTQISKIHKFNIIFIGLMVVGPMHYLLALVLPPFSTETSTRVYYFVNAPIIIYTSIYLLRGNPTNKALKIIAAATFGLVLLNYIAIQLFLDNQGFLFFSGLIYVILIALFLFWVFQKGSSMTPLFVGLIIYLSFAAVGFVGLGSFKLREISGYTDFNNIILKSIPPNSRVAVISHNGGLLHSNIFMGMPYQALDAYLVPTPAKYAATYANEILQLDDTSKIRYEDFPVVPPVRNLNSRLEALQSFGIDYIISREPIAENKLMPIHSSDDFMLYKIKNVTPRNYKFKLDGNTISVIDIAQSIGTLNLGLTFYGGIQVYDQFSNRVDAFRCNGFLTCIDYKNNMGNLTISYVGWRQFFSPQN
jgi:hypothetical protein